MQSHFDPTVDILPPSAELTRPKTIPMHSQTAQIQAALIQAALKNAVFVDSNEQKQDDALDLDSISLMVEDIDALRKQTASPAPPEHKAQQIQQPIPQKQSAPQKTYQNTNLDNPYAAVRSRPYIPSSRCYVSTQRQNTEQLETSKLEERSGPAF